MPNSKPMDQQSQVERFRQIAKQLDEDEDEDGLQEKLRMIARQKPKDEPMAKKCG